eukprot:jgi/Mesvir1/8273/Mv12539-RA.1
MCAYSVVMYRFMKTGVVGPYPTYDISETAKGTVDALICNLLSVACERAGQFVLHNAEQVRDKHVVGILHAALLAETITYMERPSLEDEVAAVKQIIDMGDLMEEDEFDEEEEEEFSDEEEEEEGEGDGTEEEEEDGEDGEEEEEEEGDGMEEDDGIETDAHGLPMPTCKCSPCADMVTAHVRWELWEPSDPLLINLKRSIPKIGATAFVSILDSSSEEEEESDEDDEDNVEC